MNTGGNYGGGGGFYYPTSNSAYGSGVVSSMRKAEQKQREGGFDPSVANYYFPQGQVISTTGGGAWQQPMGFSGQSGAQSHVHAPNCPNFGTRGNTKYPTNTGAGQSQFQIPGMAPGTNFAHTADHIEVLHGDDARAYLAQQNSGDGEVQQDASYYATPDQGNQPGMTVSFQTEAPAAPDGGSDEAGQGPGHSASDGGTNGRQRQQKGGGDYVKVNGLPMDRNPKWRQANPTMPHVYSSLRNPHGSASAHPQPTFKLCGKCPKCKDLQDPGAARPSAVNFREQGVTASGSRRFPLPKANKSLKHQGSGQGIQGGHGQPISLPIQGDIMPSGTDPGNGK